jgi:arginine decarboxylase
MPIGDAIEELHRRGDLSLGIPAQRFGTGMHMPGASRWVGEQGVPVSCEYRRRP